MLKKAAASARTMTTLHEDANVEEAEAEVSSSVPEDKCQQQLKLLDKGHNNGKEGHQQAQQAPSEHQPTIVRNQFIIDTD